MASPTPLLISRPCHEMLTPGPAQTFTLFPSGEASPPAAKGKTLLVTRGAPSARRGLAHGP